MIKRLKLTNFRGVREGELELGDLTIIMGSNNSGKTTVLEALFLAPNPLRDVPYSMTPGASWSAASVLHELHKTLNSQGYVFLLYKYISEEAIIEWNERDDLRMVVSSDKIYLSSNRIDEFPNKSSVPAGNRRITHFGTLGLQQKSENIDSSNKEFLLAPNSLLISSELVKFAHEYIRGNWARIANTRIPIEVAKDLSKFVWEDFVNITIEPHLGGGLSIFGLLNDGTRIRLGDLGAGAQVYILAKMLFEIYQPKILLFDDIEAHINPRMLLSFSEWFTELNEKGVQVVVTTHSLEAAKIIAESGGEKAYILLLSIDDGILKYQKLTLSELEDYLSAGIDVRMAESMMF